MRFAGTIPQEIVPLLAAVDSASWPTIKEPSKAPANYRYDEHMKEMVPSIPARLRKA